LLSEQWHGIYELVDGTGNGAIGYTRLTPPQPPPAAEQQLQQQHPCLALCLMPELHLVDVGPCNLLIDISLSQCVFVFLCDCVCLCMCASMCACVCMCVRLCGPASFGKEETNPTYKTKVLFQSVLCSNDVLRPHIGSLFAHCFPSSSHPAIPNDPIFQLTLSPSKPYLTTLISRSGYPQPCTAASPLLNLR